MLQERLFDLEICKYHETSDKVKPKYADLTKIFKSDFNPNMLPKMPKIAIGQVIEPHNPGEISSTNSHRSMSEDSSQCSDGYYSNQDGYNDNDA